MAVAALVVSAAGAGLSAYGAAKSASAAKAQATFNAQQSAVQSDIALFDAKQTERYGQINAGLIEAVGGMNTAITKGTADLNVDLLNGTTDFNIGVIRSTTDFNVSSAEGAARMLEARGDMAAAAHNANADYSELQAQDTLEAGNQAQSQSRLAYANLKGQQRARLAANGVTLDEGSALRIQSDTDYASDVDADTIRSNAIKTALGYRITAANERSAATFASLDGRAAALDKRADAVAAKVNGMVSIGEAEMGRQVKVADTRMTASMQILQNEMDYKIEALNTRNQSEVDAWSKRMQAQGYSANATQARAQAKAISPALAAGTSLLNGAAQVANQWYTYSQAGALGSSSKAA